MRSGGSNQRDFYRVQCRAIVDHRPLVDGLPAGRTPDSYFSESGSLALVRELMRIDQDNAQLLHAIADDNRGLGAYLAVINRKIDAIARRLVALSPDSRAGGEQEISLSEGGVVYDSTEALEPGTPIALRLSLLPSWVGIAAFAVVNKTEAGTAGANRLTVHFERLQDAERQLIARHVMQVQMAEQRRRSGRQ